MLDGQGAATTTAAVADRRGDRLCAADRRASLVSAGWALLSEGGPAAVKIDAVVARVGVTRPMFYRHFRDRAALLTALYDDYAGDMMARTRRVVDQGLAPDEMLRALFRTYLDCVGERGPWIRSLVHEAAGTPELERARARLRDRQMRTVRASLQASGAVVSPAAARLTVRVLNGLAIEAATAWLGGEASRREVERLGDGIVTGALDAIGAKA